MVDEIPERSRMILDILANEYIDYTLENQFRINENTMSYINLQLDNVVNVIDSIQFELQNLRDKKEILDVDMNLKIFSVINVTSSIRKKIKIKS